LRISHSGKSTHKQCSEKYRLHYIEKLRGPKIYSSLFFGSALDEAFSRLLLDKKLVKTEDEEKLLGFTPEEIFHKNMEQINHNGEEVQVQDNFHADYYTSDYEEALLTEQALQKLSEYAPDVEDVPAFMAEAKAVIKAKKKLSEDDQKLYNYVTWLTLVEKGLLMIEAYRTQIMPQIFEVYSIQEEVTLPNPDGDELTGKIDFTCSFVDEPGTMYVCDNKSSSKPYKESETRESNQLATYCEYKSTTKAAYVVVEKKIYKKAPIIHTQIIKDDVAEETFSATFTEFEDVLYSVSTGVFEKNFKSCFDYGRMCPYFKKCKYNKDDGLVSLKKVEDDAAKV
jgi:hypothetical protein